MRPKLLLVDRGAGQAPAHPFKRWLFAGLEVKGTQGTHTEEKEIEHPWCDVFNGVNYFSTLGYQPGIAFLVARLTVAGGYARARHIDSL